MFDPKLISWINNEKLKGYNDQQIYSTLIQQGYLPNDANGAIKFVHQLSSNVSKSTLPIKKSINHSNLISIIFVILIIIGGLFFLNSQNDAEEFKMNLNSKDVEISFKPGLSPEILLISVSGAKWGSGIDAGDLKVDLYDDLDNLICSVLTRKSIYSASFNNVVIEKFENETSVCKVPLQLDNSYILKINDSRFKPIIKQFIMEDQYVTIQLNVVRR